MMSKSDYMLSIDALPVSIAIYEATDDGDFIFVEFNKTAEKTENISRDKLIGNRLTKVFPGVEEMGLFDVLLRVSETGKDETFDIGLYEDERMSGWRKNIVTKLDNGLIMATYEDLGSSEYVKVFEKTLKKKTAELTLKNEELQRQEEYLKKSQEIAHIGVWELDMESDTLYWSDEIYNIFGIEINEFKPSYEKFLEHVHPDDRGKLQEEYTNSILEKRSYFVEHRIIRKDGSVGDVQERGEHSYNEKGEITKTVGVILDVTREKQLEKELLTLNDSLEQRFFEQTKELEKSKDSLLNQYNLLQKILDTIPVRVFWKDKDGVFLGVNDLLVMDTGLSSKDEIVGKTDFEMPWGTEEAQGYRDDDIAVMNSGVPRLSFEETQTGPNGESITLSTSKVPLKDINGELMGILGTYDDISESKELEKRAHMQEQQLIQQSRLAQMGEMISMIAHQWRQPLGAISTTAVNLQMKIELEEFDLRTNEGIEEYNKYFLKRLGNINEFVHSLTTTIDDFRNFYRPNKKSIEAKPDEVILKALAIIRASLEYDNIEVVEHYNSSEKLEMYDSEMMQVVLNILKNA
ncbi:MAG: PAS domain S-box protein, partial [Campylobacterota bacterium]